jgi:hypothetical protein
VRKRRRSLDSGRAILAAAQRRTKVVLGGSIFYRDRSAGRTVGAGASDEAMKAYRVVDPVR